MLGKLKHMQLRALYLKTHMFDTLVLQWLVPGTYQDGFPVA
jgi:hypothetical protein